MATSRFVSATDADNNYSATKDSKLVSNIYKNTKDFRDVTSYNLMRGVPDFGNLMQFTPYETGYAVFVICAIPKFMEELANYNEEYAKIIANWKHIIEYEFKSFDGFSNITADSIDLGDDLNRIQLINKVNMESSSEFTLTYDEKSGSPITKFNKLYLTGLKDPRTQVKTYHGLIHKGLMDPGFENEVFTFLFINTDNTMRYVEFSSLIIAGQINQADTDMYGSYSKGDIGKKEVNVKFTGYPIISSTIDEYAQNCLDYLIGDGSGSAKDKDGKTIGISLNSMEYDYSNSTSDIINLYNNTWGAAGSVTHYDNTGKAGKLNPKIGPEANQVPGESNTVNA